MNKTVIVGQRKTDRIGYTAYTTSGQGKITRINLDKDGKPWSGTGPKYVEVKLNKKIKK